MTPARGTKPWPPAERDAIPLPPSRLTAQVPSLREDQPEKLWRLHWEDDPNLPDRHSAGRWRFDAPDGSYPVTYANLSKQHVFVEVYGDIDDAQLIERQAERKISYATLRRPIQVIDLGDSETLRALKVDLRICTTVDYQRTMQWGQRLREWSPHAEGIRYLGRKGGREDNYCLFLDRCAGALDWTCCGTLVENEALVLEASDKFNMSFDFTIPGIWSGTTSSWR